MKMFKLFEVKEGKFKVLPSVRIRNIKGFFIASIVMILIGSLSGWLKIDEKGLWKIYHLLIERLNLKQEIPEIFDNQKKLDAKVELEVDRALQEVQPEYDRIIAEADKKYQPRYIDGINDESVCYTEECKSLAPPMRICAPWVKDCF
jgi:hypothetical protein